LIEYDLKLKFIFFIFITTLFFNFCSSKRNINIEPLKLEHDPKTEKLGKKIKNTPLNRSIYQKGIASWYGNKFHGKRTSNGEIYDMNKLTAAHKRLPFNTLVEVENSENNKRVIVRINDRGPFIKNRIIDLSFKAAKKIDIDKIGTAPVNIKIIKCTDIIKNNEIYTYSPNYYIQAGAFTIKLNADEILNKVRSILPELKFSICFTNGFYKVVSSKIQSRSKTEKYKKVLDDYEIDVFIKETP
jgi:rare lipoprotein A